MTDERQQGTHDDNETGGGFTADVEALRLDDALKLAGIAETGGQAKVLIQNGEVYVNGELETRRKRKVRPGDTVRVGEHEFTLDLEDVPHDDDE